LSDVKLRLGNLEFEWDDEKTASNLTKHQVPFAEAATAFLDGYQEIVSDFEHSDEEERFLLLATSNRLRILVIAHVARGVRIRIINARTATPRERRRYEAARVGDR
jgi:uncharacterized DUF497 family protein